MDDKFRLAQEWFDREDISRSEFISFVSGYNAAITKALVAFNETITEADNMFNINRLQELFK